MLPSSLSLLTHLGKGEPEASCCVFVFTRSADERGFVYDSTIDKTGGVLYCACSVYQDLRWLSYRLSIQFLQSVPLFRFVDALPLFVLPYLP